MGHQRLGKLPAHRRLPEIVRYLVTGGTPTGDLVDQVTAVGQDALKRAIKDPVFAEALLLLVRVPRAAEAKAYRTELANLGVHITDPLSLSGILVGYDGALEKVQRGAHANSTDLGEIARLAGLSAFAAAVRDALPGLWAPTSEDVRTTVISLKSPERFAAVAHQFYADFVARIIRYYVDRDLHNLVGPSRIARSIHDLRTFSDAIDRHCDEAALIMRAFAKDWIGKTVYRDGKEVGHDDIRRFASYAAEKMRLELAQRKGAR